jgi:uncharacterized repeat protein (TIGR03803 family)
MKRGSQEHIEAFMSRRSPCAPLFRIACCFLAAILASPAASFAAFSLTTLATFSGLSNGGPSAGLIADSQGNLFGTTFGGGNFFDGTVFELAAGSHTPTTLATFNGDNGEQPASDLISDTAGNLYGATSRGGDNGFAGTVFKVDAVTHELTDVAPVTPTNGRPNGRLYRDAQGNLFGTSAGGGFGTLFEITPGSDHLTTLVQYTGPNGRQPLGGLIADAAGNLYGTTHQGGSTFVPQGAVGFGTIFKFSPATNTLTTLASFTNDNGRLPLNDLVIDSHGNLFGTTDQGGEDSEGTIFELAAGSSTIVTLASFDDASGGEPFAPLTVDAKGNLYGTTSSEGPGGLGAVFELPSGSNKLTTLASFTGDNGAFPSSSILIDHDGNLLGTTSQGGPDDAGTIFKLTRVNVPGDYDDNGIVDHADYDLWSRTFGSTNNLAADGSGNGAVDAADYTIWRDALTSGADANRLSASVPEPAARSLMTLGLVGLFFYQRRV